jgi:hypothetical protein
LNQNLPEIFIDCGKICSLCLILASFLSQGIINTNAAENKKTGCLKNGTVVVMLLFTEEYSSQIEAGRPPLQFLFNQIAAEEGDKNSTGKKVLTNRVEENTINKERIAE